MFFKRSSATIAFGLILTFITFGSWGCKSSEQAQSEKRQSEALTSLTAEEVGMLVEAQYQSQPMVLQQLASNNEARQQFLDEEIRPLLAIAREARMNGLADEPAVRNQFELAELQALAFAYDEKLKKEQGKENEPAAPLSLIKQEDVDAFWKDGGNEAKFEQFIKILEDSSPTPQKLPEAQRAMIREQWAKATVAANKARETGLDKDPKTKLQLKFNQARVLANEYAKRNTNKFEPTQEEIDAYIKEHPEFDTSKKREQAEEVLKRARGGEDFAKLAAEFSEDPGSKDKGGLYENVPKGQMMPQFESAARALEKGKISDLVETPYGYHIIKLENKGTAKNKQGNNEETYSVRHILISTAAKDPSNPYAQPKSGADAAKAAVQQDKVKKFLDEIVARNPINLPKAEDLKITAPPQTLAMPEAPPVKEEPQDKQTK